MKVTVDMMIQHIDAIVQLVGPECVALGLDLIYFHTTLDLFFERTSQGTYTKEYLANRDPQSWRSVQPESILELINGLVKKGYDK